MGKSKNIKNKKNKSENFDTNIREEVSSVLLISFGLFFAISMHTGWTGALGVLLSSFLKGMFGIVAFVLPYISIIYGILVFIGLTKPIGIKVFSLITIIILMVSNINASRFIIDVRDFELNFFEIYRDGRILDGGGLFGTYIAIMLIYLFGKVGLYIFSISTILICSILTINKPLSSFMSKENKIEIGKKIDNIRNIEDKQFNRKKEENNEVKKPKHKNKILDIITEDKNFGIKNRDHIGVKKLEKIGLLDNPYDNDYMKGSEDVRRLLEDTGEENQKFNIELSNDKTKELDIVDNFNHNVEDVKLNTYNNIPNKEFINKRKEDSVNHLLDDKEVETPDNNVKTNKNKYKLPPLNLLDKNEKNINKKDSSSLKSNARLLEDTLRSFNVDAKVINVTRGSSVTRYEIQPAIGVKVVSIVRLADDIALNLRAKSIRIEAPIPGKAAVGIEIENENREMVTAREIFSSNIFTSNESKLTFAVGKDISGNPVVADLAKMPHMLIAGATGSGKSVCINTIITSILYRATPDEVKLILIDPKMVELGNYNGIPHLLIPVVTDSNKAAAALNWAVAEMTQRYKKFASKGVKDIKSYNKKVMEDEGDNTFTLPQIVIIIDELADLMMVASSQVEDAIARLAQLARAAGMHLIVATQRPSVDVVTGIIKANIPSRIAFMVSSQIDSRTIIDMTGAEKLVGNGDMLYKPQDMDKPMRIQAPYISEKEVHSIIDYVKQQKEEVVYSDEIIEKVENPNSLKNETKDELMDDAIEVIFNSGQASASMLQRRFRIGYNRAARMIDIMEEMGIIGRQDGSKPRSLLMSKEEYLEKIKSDEAEQ